eukprot:2181492-Pyramimonas_sp.AAC.1
MWEATWYCTLQLYRRVERDAHSGSMQNGNMHQFAVLQRQASSAAQRCMMILWHRSYSTTCSRSSANPTLACMLPTILRT